MSDKNLENLVPSEARVLVGGQEYVVKKLGLKQSIKLIALASSLQEGAREKIMQAAESGLPDLVAIVSGLAEDTISELLQILLAAPSLEDKKRFDAVTLEEIAELSDALTKVNDFQKIFRSFQKAAERLGGLVSIQAGTHGTQPPPSSRE